MKTTPLSILTAAGMFLSVAVQGQVQLFPKAEATVRDGSNFNVDMNEATLGYLMVKYGSGSSGKAYFKFDFTGRSPNTNSGLSFTFTTASASARQHAQMWALKQPYPEFTNSYMVWATAQANQTNGNSLLTDPTNTFTAIPLMDFISPSSGGATRTVTIPAPWGDYVFGNELVLVLTSPFNEATNQSGGFRPAINLSSVTFTPLSEGSPPSVSAISNITVMAGQASATQAFTVSDPEDGSGALWPVATSTDEAVLPAANVLFEGTGGNLTVQVIGGATPGIADITVTVLDSAGNAGQRTFRVTVTAADFPPSISAIPPTNTLINTPLTIPFSVGDAETPASSLTVDGTIASYSSGLLATLAFGADASGTNRTVTVTPVVHADGIGIVTLSVTDSNSQTNSVSFAVMVLPATNVVFSEHFDYPLNTSILNSSPGFWMRRNASVQSLNFRTSSADAQAWIRPKSGADDAAAPLAKGPYEPGSGAVLYTMFTAQWIDAGDIPVVGDSDGAFILLAPTPSATADQLVQIATRTNGVAESLFRLLISNGTGAYAEYSSQDLSIATPYKIVVRYDVDTAKSTLWIDGTSEASPSVSATDDQAPASVGYLCIRQEPNMGNIYLDDLRVVLLRKPKVIAVTQPSGGTVNIYFVGGPGDAATDFLVTRAAAVDGLYEEVGATITSTGADAFRASVPVSGDQGFFRLKRRSVAF